MAVTDACFVPKCYAVMAWTQQGGKASCTVRAQLYINVTNLAIFIPRDKTSTIPFRSHRHSVYGVKSKNF